MLLKVTTFTNLYSIFLTIIRNIGSALTFGKLRELDKKGEKRSRKTKEMSLRKLKREEKGI